MTVTRKQLHEATHDLIDAIPEMDPGELAILIPLLGRALVRAIGLNGSFAHIYDYNLYHIELMPHFQREVSVQGTKPLIPHSKRTDQ